MPSISPVISFTSEEVASMREIVFPRKREFRFLVGGGSFVIEGM